MAFNLAKQIDVRSTCSNIDILYGPYNSIEEACLSVPKARRKLGRTLGIITEGSLEEYWWKSGIEDADLETKNKEELPSLNYTDDFPKDTIIKKDVGDSLFIKVYFKSPTYGQCTITVNKDGIFYKSFKTNKGIITLDLGVIVSEGTAVYTITAVDALTIPAEEELKFTVVTGGASIVSDLQNIIDSGINTSSNITVRYTASVADTSKVVKFYGVVYNSEGVLVKQEFLEGTEEPKNILKEKSWNIGVLSTSDTYTIKLSAYTGSSPDDVEGDNVSKTNVYTFLLLDSNDFRLVADTEGKSGNTDTIISVPFRIYSGGISILQARGELYKATVSNTVFTPTGEPISGYSLNRSVASNIINYWALGKVKEAGNYVLRMWATTIGQEDAPLGRVYTYIPLVIEAATHKYNIIREGLIAEFLADGKSNNNDADTKGYWENEVKDSNIRFKLVDLNYNTNGWKHTDESIPDSTPEGEMMLKFSGESYGILKQGEEDYNPLSELINPLNKGVTCEIIFRTRCIGELDTKVITGHSGKNTNTAGFSASYDKLSVGSNDAQIVYDVAENEWIHAAFVIDKKIHTNVPDVQDYAPNPLMTVYVNGSACAASIISDTMSFTNYGKVLLNAAINPVTNKIDYFGNCEIKAIRFYNRPLYASEIVNNRIASVYNEEEQSIISGRNGDVLPIVKFVNINKTHPQNPLPAGVTLQSFADLNKMTEKAEQKKKYVCCSIYYQENSNSEVLEWPRAIVQTQGTSTLAFPVKNYKIKLYDPSSDAYTKKWSKCSDYVNIFANKGWDKEDTFTLKCDYMEAAHLNNTPSCIFYNDTIDRLIESGDIATGWNEDNTLYDATKDERSPSRRSTHFDAIKGFPCLVYYYDSEEDYYENNGTYVGTYMFNLDKGANSLGFKDAATLGEDGSTYVPIENPRYNPEDPDSKQHLKNICQSFEGVANGSDTAGCFYSYEDWKTSFYNTYLTGAYTSYKNDNPSSELTFDGFVEYYSIHKEPYNSNGDILLSKEEYLNKESKFKTEYDYLAADYEQRYDYDDLDSGGEEYWGNSNWGLVRMINWVSDASKTAGLATKEHPEYDRFKSEFNNYFNFKYCGLYYLNMIVFGQVDNAGKNSMWDTWNGKIWYPRPYDLDTAVGLDNTGFEVIEPDAELIQELSPFKNFNGTTGIASYSEDVGEKANIRYRAYNTRTSRFWIAFATSFKEELNALYKKLRDSNIYSIKHISDIFVGNTSDIIGESYYNRDMTTKFYKLADINTFISRMHGNRVQKFKSWMTKRLVFCDSLFEYKSEDKSLNNNIILRSDAVETGGTISLTLGVKTYSPQYIRVDVGSGYDAKIEGYCSPDSRYKDPLTGETKEGILFTIPLAGGDKEIQISGSGNIREFTNLGAFKPKSLILTYATRLTNLDLSYSTKLLSLALKNNTYLQSLDCTGAIQLGTEASGAQLDLSNCVNLKDVKLDKTKLTSVVFPIGGALKSVSVKNTAITGIELDSLHFLSKVDVSNCENILSYKIVNCPKLSEITADELPLTKVEINSCKGLNKISLRNDTLIQNFSITNCPNISILDFTNNRSPALSTLQLTSLYGLEELYLGGSIVNRIKFPLKSSATSSENWGSNFRVLNITGSNIQYIQYGEAESESVDMGQLTGLTSLTFNNCPKIEHITRLSYSGNCNSLFAGCTNLQDIQGTIKCIGPAASMFSTCYNLNTFEPTLFDFAECTTLNNAFYRCAWIKYTDIKKLLNSCGNSLTSIDSLCYAKNIGEGNTIPEYPASAKSQYTTLPDNFFGNCKKVTSASTMFWNSGLEKFTQASFVDSNGGKGLAKLKNASLMFGNTKITTVFSTIMNMLPSLTNAAGMFMNDSLLEFTLPNTFFGSDEMPSSLTTIAGMFYGCSKVSVNMNDMLSLLTPIENLQDASLLFYGCTRCTGTIPDGFFSTNTNLRTIAGCFAYTNIEGIGTSRSLLNTAGMPYLTDISGLFSNCKNLAIAIRSNIFEGGNAITSLGYEEILIPSGSYLGLEGLFSGCNQITMFGKDLFNKMPALRNISQAFKNCSSLSSQIGGTFDATFLSTHQNIRDAHEMFSGCSNLAVSSMPSIFEASKGTIQDIHNLFEGCVKIGDFDSNIFKNMPSLTNTSAVFKGCTGLSCDMTTKKIFEGCTALGNVSECFSGCTNISGSIPEDLFNSCRATLTNTSAMFYNCENLNGNIGTGNEDLISPDSPSYKLGLLSECLQLTTVKDMFSGCKKLGSNSSNGAIPWDMFYTRNDELLYNKLTDASGLFYDCGFKSGTKYTDDVYYLFHPDFMKKLYKLTTTERMFAKPWNATQKYSGVFSIHPNSFDMQSSLATIKEMFYNCDGLGGAITSNWFVNSLTTLTDAYGAFAKTAITEIGSTFLRLNNSSPNTKLTSVSRMFYNCSRITSTSALPQCNSTAQFTRINYSNPDIGYLSYAYGCTNASNYSSFDEPWIREQSY